MTKTQARRAAQLQRANKKNEEKKMTESGKTNDIICSAGFCFCYGSDMYSMYMYM